jgi:hypothetical protein
MKAKELTELGEWKVGQEVCIHGKHSRSSAVIDRITDGRGGTIYADKGAYDTFGNSRGTDIWNGSQMELMTPALKESMQKTNRRNKLCNFRFSSLTLDQASDLVLKMREMGIVI